MPMSGEKSNIAGPDAPNRPVLRPGVGERLRTARAAIGLRQMGLAEAGGVSRATQVSYEAGTTEPTTQYLRDI
jgi:DNA-binding XRE family transcriptional regulator